MWQPQMCSVFINDRPELFQKKLKRGVEDILFEKTAETFRFFTLHLLIPDKKYFLDHPWKFQIVFNYPLKNPLAFSSVPLEIPHSQPPACFFSGIAHEKISLYYRTNFSH